MAEYDDGKDPAFSETPVKNKRKSNGRKGNVPPKTYVVPNLINNGDTSSDNFTAKVNKQQTSGGYKAGWRPRPENSTQTPEGQNVKYQAPRGGGKATISELPGQMTGPVPVPTKPKSPAPPSKGKPVAKKKGK
jgi:hypothetical protein